MHKKFILIRIFDLPVFFNGARLTCHAKAPDRRSAGAAPRAWAFGPRVRWGRLTRQTANRRVAVPAPGVAARRRRRITALAKLRCRLEGFGRPCAPPLSFGEGSPFSPCAGAALRRRRLWMSVRPDSSSEDAALQGATDLLAVGAVSPGSALPHEGSAISSPRPFSRRSRPRLMRRRVVPCPGHEAAGILPLHPASHSVWGPVWSFN